MGAQVKWRNTHTHTHNRLIPPPSFPLSWVQGGDRQLIELVQNKSARQKVCACTCVYSAVNYLPQQKCQRDCTVLLKVRGVLCFMCYTYTF